MTDLQKVLLIALGLLLMLCVVVSATLRHYIGGFLETVAREEEASGEETAQGQEACADRQENKA